MNALEPIDIRTGRPFASRRAHLYRPSIDGESIEGGWGRARGLLGGAFMGCMMAQQGSSLPYDYEVEYLQSSGTQVIDTGLYIDDTCGMSARFYKMNDSDTIVCGLCGSGYGNDARWAINISKNLNLSWNATYAAMISAPNAAYTVQINWLNDRERVLDGVEKTSITQALNAGVARYTVGLFAAHWRADSWSLYCTCRLYWLKISRGQSVIFDVIPVVATIDGATEACMYDRISGQLLRNSGTDSFVAGPRVN